MGQDEKKEYELSFLLKIHSPEEVVFSLVKKIALEMGGSQPGRQINLAYPIKKEMSAIFGVYDFTANPSDIAKLKSQLSSAPEILRFLLVTPPVRVGGGFSRPQIKPVPKAPEEKADVNIKIGPETLTNEALEQKLEEILK